MKIEELKGLFESHTKDGDVDFEAVNKAVNEQFDVLIDAKVTKAKASVKSENITEFLTEQGFENMDQYTSFVKNSKAASTELSEKATRLETEYGAMKAEYEKLKADNENYTYMSKATGFAEKYRKFAVEQAKGLVSDDLDFDTALTKVQETYPEWTGESASIVTKTPKGQTKPVQGDGVLGILESKHNIKLE